jgi:methyl-accepting chemotaxis protein
MQWFKNLSTIVKILTLVAVMFILMLVVAYTGYYTSMKIAVKMQDMYDNYAKIALFMTESKAMAIENRRMVLSMINSTEKDENESYKSRIMANRTAIAENVSAIDENRLTEEELEFHSNLKRIGPVYRSMQDEAIAGASSKTGLDEVIKRVGHAGDIGDIENEYVSNMDKLAGSLVKTSDEVSDGADKFAVKGTMRIASTAFIAMLVGIVLSVVISRVITVPIKKIQASVKLFAEGDLSNEFPVKGKDELAVMGRGLQDMAENLRSIIGAVKSANEKILDASQDFSALAQEANASVGEFRTNVDKMGTNLDTLAATGEEVNASVQEVAAGAQTTAEKGTDIARKVDDAMKAGEDGVSSVRRAVSGIESVVNNASSTAKSVQELGERTRQIQNFVSQIGGIADQTNLLALNAAIEAARAGEAGRGFAVVAEEVRKLAEESNVAAKSIEDLAKTIMGDLDTVVNQSLDNAKASEDAKSLSKDTERIIDNMIAYLKEISSATQDLAAVAEEQAASSEEISEAVQNISMKVHNAADSGDNIRSGIADVSSASERIALSSESLSNLVKDLETQLNFFKLDKGSPLGGSNNARKLALKARFP